MLHSMGYRIKQNLVIEKPATMKLYDFLIYCLIYVSDFLNYIYDYCFFYLLISSAVYVEWHYY